MMDIHVEAALVSMNIAPRTVARTHFQALRVARTVRAWLVRNRLDHTQEAIESLLHTLDAPVSVVIVPMPLGTQGASWRPERR